LSCALANFAAAKRSRWNGLLASAHAQRSRSFPNCSARSFSRGIVSFFGFQYSSGAIAVMRGAG
jgi:hypothetical protein